MRPRPRDQQDRKTNKTDPLRLDKIESNNTKNHQPQLKPE